MHRAPRLINVMRAIKMGSQSLHTFADDTPVQLFSRTRDHLARGTFHLIGDTYHLVRATYHLPRATYHLVRGTYHLSRATYHLVKRYLSPSKSHYSPSKVRLPPIKSHLSPSKSHLSPNATHLPPCKSHLPSPLFSIGIICTSNVASPPKRCVTPVCENLRSTILAQNISFEKYKIQNQLRCISSDLAQQREITASSILVCPSKVSQSNLVNFDQSSKYTNQVEKKKKQSSNCASQYTNNVVNTLTKF